MSFWFVARNVHRDAGAAVAFIASGTVLTGLHACLMASGPREAAQAPLAPGVAALLLAGAGVSFLVGARIGLRGYRHAMGQKDEGIGQ